ncbi:MAG: prolyl-tRNA synthetase associated domain-containing protein [Rhodospirillaceae bacterium]|nr:prolyl-tRNA synthetase associated domain-containing protein [Rhodospirillaceae bacterium]
MTAAPAPCTPEQLLARLRALGIAAPTLDHPPAFTVAEAERHAGHLPGVHVKNLFLCDAKKKMWLVSAPFDRALDLKKLPDVIGSSRLSFGSADRLRRTLGLEPGSVTPFAIVNDPGRTVTLVLDAWMMAQSMLNAHPLTNTMTTAIAPADLMRFAAACGHRPLIVDLARAAPAC